jgi:hypothetical protein
MPNDPYPESKLQKSEFGTLLPDVLHRIVKPQLSELINLDTSITNKSTLHAAFKKATQSTVSFSTFNTWLEMLGIAFRKTIQIDGLVPAPTPGGAGVGPRPDVGEEDVKFDNEETFDFRPSRGFGDAFGEIARNSGGIQ